MAALTTNRQMESKSMVDSYLDMEVAAGALDISAGEFLVRNATGYVTPATDTDALKFAGYSLDAVVQLSTASAADNKIRVVPAGSQKWVKMTFATAITRASVGNACYVSDSSLVDVYANVTNHVQVGVIREFVSTTVAWVEMTGQVFEETPAAE